MLITEVDISTLTKFKHWQGQSFHNWWAVIHAKFIKSSWAMVSDQSPEISTKASRESVVINELKHVVVTQVQ